MLSFNAAHAALLEMEHGWFDELPSACPDPQMCNGEVQFFSIERDPVEPLEEPLPVVIAVGANFTQSSTLVNYPQSYIGNKAGVAVEEPWKRASIMRQRLDGTLQIFSTHKEHWKERLLVSSANLQLPKRYLLIATNLSPFITKREWQNYESAERANLLAAPPSWMDYLTDLRDVFANHTALYVAHGLNSEVFSLFRYWQTSLRINEWLLTANLARPITNYVAGKRTPFYLRARI